MFHETHGRKHHYCYKMVLATQPSGFAAQYIELLCVLLIHTLPYPHILLPTIITLPSLKPFTLSLLPFLSSPCDPFLPPYASLPHVSPVPGYVCHYTCAYPARVAVELVNCQLVAELLNLIVNTT